MPALDQYIALEVNGEAVSLADVLRLAKMTGQLRFIQDSVDAVLIRQAVAERGLAVTGDELQQAADEFRLAHDLHSAEATESWLAGRHLSFADWETLLESDLLRHKLRDALTGDQIEQHFIEHKLSFDAAVISRLVVGDEDVARELRAQIVEEGQDFHQLARQYSNDERTRLAGGYSGSVGRNEMEAAVESAVFGSQPGRIVGPLKTDDGWQLIKLESLHPATLDESLREAITSQLFEEWLAERRHKARIKLPVLEEPAEDEV